jgi:RimJ/RimL family protein N-acetyltransferase
MDRRIPSEPVRVAGDGLSLRPFTPDDVQAMSRAYADPEIAQWNSSAPPAKSGLPADLEARIATRQDWSDGTHASWVIGGADDALVGSISLHHVEYDMGNGQVG